MKFCRCQDLNRGSLVSEATVLPTEPQPLPIGLCLYRLGNTKLRLPLQIFLTRSLNFTLSTQLIEGLISGPMPTQNLKVTSNLLFQHYQGCTFLYSRNCWVGHGLAAVKVISLSKAVWMLAMTYLNFRKLLAVGLGFAEGPDERRHG